MLLYTYYTIFSPKNVNDFIIVQDLTQYFFGLILGLYVKNFITTQVLTAPDGVSSNGEAGDTCTFLATGWCT